MLPLLTLFVLHFVGVPHHAAAARVMPNDNRTAAGTLSRGVLTLRLEAVPGLWYPEGDSGPGIEVYAFAEVGKAPQIPGPLMRVPAGTEIRTSITNRLPSAIILRGLQDHGAAGLDTVQIAVGATRELRFRADAVGTFFYVGRTSPGTALLSATNDSQLLGALIVDAPGVMPPADERVLMLSLWQDTMRAPGYKVEEKETIVVNGLSWPHTERLHYTVGDTVHFRVINASVAPHPMHLHGFYYTVLSRGNAVRDTVYTTRQRRQAVTEFMTAGSTMAMQWVPTRPGNWLFHCHLIYHIDAALRLTELPDSAHHGNHAIEAMAGLITGIEVAPKKGGTFAADPVARRNIRLFANERANVFGSKLGYSFIMQNGPNPPAIDSVQFPSSTLLLRKGEPTAITVINRTHNAVSIHWHGIELESYYDGVAGWSGWKGRVQPMIAPGDTFVVRMTPDRSGTFIYHTHSDESNQLNSGLYGPLFVLDEGASPDPNERIFLIGEGGPQANALPFVNGSATPAPIDMRVGATHRIRLINISAASRKRIRLVADTTLLEWKAAAKDGADLTPDQAVMRPAEVLLGPGETADFDVTRSKSEVLTLEIVTPHRDRPPQVTRIPVVVR